MTILEQTYTQKSQPAAAVPAKLPRVAEPVQRFAAQLRTNGNRGPQVLMITSVSPSRSVLHIAYETALALVQINESPVLVLDLERNPVEGIPLSVNWPAAAMADITPALPSECCEPAAASVFPTLAVIRPLDNVDDPVAYLSSPKFARVIEDARKSFALILIAASCVTDSVGTLVASSLCDGVVLLVKQDESTISMLEEVRQVLERNRAKLLGFLYEKR
jgi:Mrp family chromosome partitioning ATPase